MIPRLIDTHIHLNASIYEGDLREIIDDAMLQGVTRWIVPSTMLSDIPRQLEIAALFPECKNAFGIHPWFIETIEDDWATQLEIAIREYRPIAIGECGLDFSRDHEMRQQAVFEKQVAMAVKYHLPLIIHSYKAVDSVLKILRKYPQAKGVFHALNASIQQLEQILDLGFYVGFGGAVTYDRAKRLQALLAQTPDHRIVLETDGPFQPGSYRESHERHLPVDLISIAKFVAEKKSRSLSEIAKITTDNAIHLFNLEIK